MAEAADLIEQAPLQDRDLLLRLSLYFDAFEQRLRQGQGWFIFNAPGMRASRISTFISHRVAEFEPNVSAHVMNWRDFALSAYVSEVGMPVLNAEHEQAGATGTKQGLEIARMVNEQTHERLVASDLLVLTDLKPNHWAEATFLDRTIDERYRLRRATILLTPEMPTNLEAEFETVDPSGTCWPRLFQRMYETSLVAL